MMDTVAGRGDPPGGTPPKKWVKTLNCKQATSTELVIDATLSTGTDPKTASFVEVRGGSWGMWEILDRTNHVTNGDRPAGSNIMFVDGHLEWRHFNEMDFRRTGPVHWW